MKTLSLKLTFLIVLVAMLNSYLVDAQTCVCAVCGKLCSEIAVSGHRKGYSCYVEPAGSTVKQSSSSAGTQTQATEMLIQGAVNALINAATQKSQAEIDAEKRAAELAAQRAAEEKRRKEAEEKAKNDKLNKSYKPLSNTELKYKPLDKETDVQREQRRMKTETQTWVEYQKEQFRIRTEQPNYWCKQYYADLLKKEQEIENRPWCPYKRFDELEPGDVLLFEPREGDLGGAVVADVGNWGQESKEAAISHTVTYLKEINGKKMFLDCFPGEGPKIIDEDALRQRYLGRTASVAEVQKDFHIAQPLNEEEAERLWNKARELEIKNNKSNLEKKDNWFDNTNYGLFGSDNMVCSEASWTLLKTAGRDLPLTKSWATSLSFVDFSPADFYSYKQYFLITPLSISKE